jgi:hypothetical protein
MEDYSMSNSWKFVSVHSIMPVAGRCGLGLGRSTPTTTLSILSVSCLELDDLSEKVVDIRRKPFFTAVLLFTAVTRIRFRRIRWSNLSLPTPNNIFRTFPVDPVTSKLYLMFL